MKYLSMTYQGYTGVVREFEPETGTIYGHVVGLQGGMTFQAETGADLVREFHASVDDYLEWCEERKVEPEKPYSGKFLVRLSSELHKRAAVEAKRQGASLNTYVKAAVRQAVKRDRRTPDTAPKPLPAVAQAKPRKKPATAKSSKPSK